MFYVKIALHIQFTKARMWSIFSVSEALMETVTCFPLPSYGLYVLFFPEPLFNVLLHEFLDIL